MKRAPCTAARSRASCESALPPLQWRGESPLPSLLLLLLLLPLPLSLQARRWCFLLLFLCFLLCFLPCFFPCLRSRRLARSPGAPMMRAMMTPWL